jgi:ribonuclease BN (tRNA processing enzyme)
VKIRVLGCHGSDLVLDGYNRHQCRTSGFLINGAVMVDAGTIAAALRLDEIRKIRHILVSHLHFDHIKGLPTLADSLVDAGSEPVSLTSTTSVLDGLTAHIFNNQIYPDFLQLPDPDKPVYRKVPMDPNSEFQVEGLRVTAVPVNHLVPTVGFLIRDRQSSILYSGDTYVTDEIWAQAAREPTLKAAFIETSFPDEMHELAAVSKHLTPSLFAREFKKIGKPDLPVYVYHLKPRFRQTIERELSKLGIKHLVVLEEDQEIEV